MKKQIEDNKTAKAEARQAILPSALAIGEKYLTTLEYEILTKVLLNNQTFREIGEAKQLTSYRVKAIFEKGLRRHLALLSKIGEKIQDYDKLEEKHRLLEKEHNQLQGKLEKHKEIASALAKLTPETRALLKKPISEVGLSARVKNICEYNNIMTLSDLVKVHRHELLKFRNCGKHTISEFEDFFKDNGLTWGMV